MNNKISFFQKKKLQISALEKKYRRLFFYGTLIPLFVTTINLRKQVIKLKIEVAQVKNENKMLVQNMIIFNRNYEEFPLPIWQKVKRGDEFIIQYINPTYVDFFGHIFNNDQYAVIGKNNFDLFPKLIAQGYYKNDVAVSITGKPLETIEESLDKNGRVMKLKVLKWRDIKEKKDTLVYGMVKEILKD